MQTKLWIRVLTGGVLGFVMKRLSGLARGRGLAHSARSGRSRIGGLVRLLAVTTLAVPIAMVDLSSARAVTNNSMAGGSGSVHYSQSGTPRTVTLRNLPQARPVHKEEAYVQGGVPPSTDSVQATGKGPPVVSDMPTATTATPTVNLENLVSFIGAKRFPDGSCSPPDPMFCEPPDTQMAVGNDLILEVVNTRALIFARGGFLLKSIFLADMLKPLIQNVGIADPRVLFDPTAGINGRYYLTMMVCQDASCLSGNWTHMGVTLLVSQTDDPLDGWFVYNFLGDGKNLLDQEKLGFSRDKVTYTVNEFKGTCKGHPNDCPLKQEDVVVLQKSDLLVGDAVRSAIITKGFALNSMPTTPVNASRFDPIQYVVWNAGFPGLPVSNFMEVFRITGTPAGRNVTFWKETLPIAGTPKPPAGVQRGWCFNKSGKQIPCTVAADDTSFQSAVVQGNDLWAVSTDGCEPQGDTTVRACTHLVEVKLNNSVLGHSTIVHDIDIGSQGTYRYRPSVMKDSFGNLFFGFTISSSTLFPTAAVDASPRPQLELRVFHLNYATGQATYTDKRWGDYSALAQDPREPGDVWAAQEFVACFTKGCHETNSANWATALGQFTFGKPSILAPVSPDSGPATGGTLVDIFGADFANGVNSGTSVTFGSTPAQSVTWIDAGHIQAVSPASEPGTVDITVTTLNGTSEISSNDKFTFEP